MNICLATVLSSWEGREEQGQERQEKDRGSHDQNPQVHGKGGAIVDTQAEVIIMEQGEPGGRVHAGVTWDQRSDGVGEVPLWSLSLNIPI